MNKTWRKLDNTAKIFSVDKKEGNMFRLSVILKEKVDYNILKDSVIKTLELFNEYKVGIKTGFFWNYLEVNCKNPIIEEEKEKPCKVINFKKNNDYLFKVTYFNNKINLDIYHVLTDGVGATAFFKSIIYNYLNLKYELTNEYINNNYVIDEYLKNVDKSIKFKRKEKYGFLIKEKSNLSKNKTFHYILDLKKLKKICKQKKVSITEYLTAIYISALYKTVYDKKSNKDISVTIPVDLRKYYNSRTLSNFFTCMTVEGNLVKSKYFSFEKVLKQVHNEFKEKLGLDNIKNYLTSDVKLGTNLAIRLVPLFLKKIVIQNFNRWLCQKNTTSLSNIGPIEIEEKYKKYIDNIMLLVNSGKLQKIKCSICSYENKLTVTINSNLIKNDFEKEFYKLLQRYIGKVGYLSNVV